MAFSNSRSHGEDSKRTRECIGGMVRDNPEINKQVSQMTALGPEEGLGGMKNIAPRTACRSHSAARNRLAPLDK